MSTITKGLIGIDDMSLGTSTFTRTTSTGGTATLTQVDFVRQTSTSTQTIAGPLVVSPILTGTLTFTKDPGVIQGFNTSGATPGGVVTITAGSNSGGSAAGGALNLRSGSGSSGANGGAIAVAAANGAGTGNGGAVSITSGSGLTSGAVSISSANSASVGAVGITAGNGVTGGNGGVVNITGGNGNTAGNGGSINLTPGSKAGGGTDGAVNISKLIGQYNGISTVGNGVPAEYATVDLTGQTAPIAATTLYAPTISGLFRVSAYLKITTTGTSPVLGPVTITFTDATDSVAQSVVMSQQLQTGATSNTGNNGNTTGSVLTGSLIVNAKAATNIQYAVAFTGTIGAAQYEVHLKLEAL